MAHGKQYKKVGLDIPDEFWSPAPGSRNTQPCRDGAAKPGHVAWDVAAGVAVSVVALGMLRAVRAIDDNTNPAKAAVLAVALAFVLCNQLAGGWRDYRQVMRTAVLLGWAGFICLMWHKPDFTLAEELARVAADVRCFGETLAPYAHMARVAWDDYAHRAAELARRAAAWWNGATSSSP